LPRGAVNDVADADAGTIDRATSATTRARTERTSERA